MLRLEYTPFSTRVKMSAYANPFIELAPVLDATLQIGLVYIDQCTGAPKLINSDLFLEKRATVPIKTQGVQRSSSGKMSTF